MSNNPFVSPFAPIPGVTAFRTGYMDKAFYSLDEVVDDAATILRDIEFDSFVGTGFSGAFVIPALALRMKKHFTLIRKEHDDSHHGPGALVGRLGEQWIFVDDLISSGYTKRRVITKVGAACVVQDHITTYVGDYLYGGAVPRFLPHGNDPFNEEH